MTAEEARRISNEALKGLKEEEITMIEKLIETSANRGMTYIHLYHIHDESIAYFEEKGYKIHKGVMMPYFIKWDE